MGAIPDAVKQKVGDMPDLGSMDKDALSALAKQLYDQSCAVFAEKFNMEHEIKKNEVEIHALELEVNDMHGKFIIPALKKVSNFKLMGVRRPKSSLTPYQPSTSILQPPLREHTFMYVYQHLCRKAGSFSNVHARACVCVCISAARASVSHHWSVRLCRLCLTPFLCRLPLFSQPTEINFYSFSSRCIYFFLILVSSILNSLHSSTFCYLCLYKKILNCETKTIESWTPTIIASRWTCVHLKCTAHVPQTRSAVCTNTVGPSALFCLPVIQG